MREIKLPLGREFRTRKFYNIFYEFDNTEELNNLCLYCKKNNNYTILERYLDLFIKYIYEIIDYSDEFLCVSRSNGLTTKIKTIKHHQEQVICNDEVQDIVIYCIKDEEDKNILKEIFSFNILPFNNDNQIIDIPLNKKYLRNSKKKHKINEKIYFFKENDNFFTMELDTGLMIDYRSNKLYYEHLNKYNGNSLERIQLKKDFKNAVKEGMGEKIESNIKGYQQDNSSLLTRWLFKIYHIFYEFIYRDEYDFAFEDLLWYCKRFNDYTILERYLDLFMKFMGDVIDYSDEFICRGREDSMQPILDKLPHSIQKIRYGEEKYDVTIYSINKKRYKNILKNNLSFNITVSGEEAYVIPINKNYLRNDEKNLYHNYSEVIKFRKNNRIIFTIDLDMGELIEYFNPEFMKVLLNKYNNDSKERVQLKNDLIKAVETVVIERMKLREEYYSAEYDKYVKKRV